MVRFTDVDIARPGAVEELSGSDPCFITALGRMSGKTNWDHIGTPCSNISADAASARRR